MIETQAYVNALQDAMPQVLNNEQDARRAVDTVFAVITRGLKNRDAVTLEGVGEIRSEPTGDGKKDVVFAPSRDLLDEING